MTYNSEKVYGFGFDCRARAWALHGDGFKVVATFPTKAEAALAFYGSKEGVRRAEHDAYLDRLDEYEMWG